MPLKNILFPPLNNGTGKHQLAYVEQTDNIPRIIHQTYYSKKLPQEFQENVNNLINRNPNWEYRFYDDKDIIDFISSNYEPVVLQYFNRINPKYGAARSDLFRYLLLYKVGGVYLDIKSNINQPIDDIILSTDRFLLAHWCNEEGQGREGFGLWKELKEIPEGEFQQWHIISSAGHPFLRAVILSVLNNIDHYRPWIHGVGGKGVVNVTGPIAYTLAILPLLDTYKHRNVGKDKNIGLSYCAINGSHLSISNKPHYRTLDESIVIMEGIINNLLEKAYIMSKRAYKHVCRIIKSMPTTKKTKSKSYS